MLECLVVTSLWDHWMSFHTKENLVKCRRCYFHIKHEFELLLPGCTKVGWPFGEYIYISAYIPFLCCEFFSSGNLSFSFESSFYSKNTPPSGVTVPGEVWSDYVQLLVADFEEVCAQMITGSGSMKFLGGISSERLKKKKVQCKNTQMQTNKLPHASWSD